MKTIKTILSLAMLPFAALAQTGNPNENNAVKVEYLSATETTFKFKVTSKQACTADYKITYLNVNDKITLAPGASAIIETPNNHGALVSFAAKAQSACDPTAVMGWVSADSPSFHALPITFKSIRSKRNDNGTITVTFEVAEASGVNYYNIRTSKDGIEFKTTTVVFPDDTKPNSVYSVIIKL